jgi:hypothetical protein
MLDEFLRNVNILAFSEFKYDRLYRITVALGLCLIGKKVS